MNFDAYLQDIPNLHSWDGGKTWNTGGFEAIHLRALYELAVKPEFANATIIETGAGNSTLAFLFAKPKKLISIAPDGQLFERIKAFCKTNELSISNWDIFIERSEWTLPELAAKGSTADIGLIDGCHSWPAVFVDFCYINAMMREGGLLIVDDIQLHTVKELARLLVKDNKNFALECDLEKALVFRKLNNELFQPGWGSQPYIREKSRGATFNLESPVGNAGELLLSKSEEIELLKKQINEKDLEIHRYYNRHIGANASVWRRSGGWLENQTRNVKRFLGFQKSRK